LQQPSGQFNFIICEHGQLNSFCVIYRIGNM